jgi:hypothetical protein
MLKDAKNRLAPWNVKKSKGGKEGSQLDAGMPEAGSNVFSWQSGVLGAKNHLPVLVGGNVRGLTEMFVQNVNSVETD